MIEVIQGSILDFQGDAIVNPANSHLRHGGGLARVIADAAIGPVGGDESESLAGWAHGPQDFPKTQIGWDWKREQEDAPLVATGAAHATSAGHLPYRYIIHAVGPVWGGGSFHESALLTSAYRESIELADDLGCKSIALPAISAGIFGVPIELVVLAADLAIAEIERDTPAILNEVDISFYLFSDEHYKAFSERKWINTRRNMLGIK